jgi:hypothetical protein
MGVRKEEVGKRERDSVAHHLPLSSLAAIHQNRLAFPNDSKRTDATLDRGARGGGAEEANEEWHRGNIERDPCTDGPAFALTCPCKAGTAASPVTIATSVASGPRLAEYQHCDAA